MGAWPLNGNKLANHPNNPLNAQNVHPQGLWLGSPGQMITYGSSPILGSYLMNNTKGSKEELISRLQALSKVEKVLLGIEDEI